MFTCTCCGRRVASSPSSTSPYRRTGHCRYCSGFPHSSTGTCLGVHGPSLTHHLDALVADGFWTRELAQWWRDRDREELTRPAG